MDGLLVIDKPEGLTSHDVVSRVRKILKTKRVGHTGTLDPFATGVLVVLIGKATRLARFLDKDEKEYEASVKFGSETDTGDRTGTRIPESAMQSGEVAGLLARADWERLLARFSGRIEQVPPMYSAKKVEGKKLYELARKGLEVHRKPVTIHIHELEVLGPEPEAVSAAASGPEPASSSGGPTQAGDTVSLRVVCSAGTYIRTLAEDIGRELGSGAHLEELRRTRAGRFDLSKSLTLEELAELANPESHLIPMNEAVSHLPEMVLSPARVEKTRNGMSSLFFGDADEGQAIRMVNESGELVAVGTYKAGEKSVQPKVVLM
jgi:tRNA pseudouridine55 synthase